MLSLVNVAEKLMGDKFRKKTFDNARALINDPNAKYMKYANSLLDEVAPNVIKVHTLNLGYQAGFYGYSTTTEFY